MTENQTTDTTELMNLADAGNADAQFELAIHYLKDGLENLKLALSWLLKAAENNHAAAQYTLGLIYLVNEHEDIGHVLLGRWSLYKYTRAIEIKDDFWKEKLFVSWMLLFRLEKFSAEVNLSNKPSEADIILAKNKVADFIQQCIGKDTSENDKSAIYWLNKASENHHPEAKAWLDACYPDRYQSALKQDEKLIRLYQACLDGKLDINKGNAEVLANRFLEELAKSDNDEYAGKANYLLAIECFENGCSDAKKHSFNYGLDYLRDAIDCGNIDACTLLENAFLRFTFSEFYNREDAEACYKFAYSWLIERLKEDSENIVLNFAFGVLLAFGKGVEKDSKRAVECINRVYIQDQGYISALEYFADIYLRVCGGKSSMLMEPNIIPSGLDWYFSDAFDPDKAGYYVLPSLIFDFYDDISSAHAFSRKLEKAKDVFHSYSIQRELEWKQKYAELETRRRYELEETMAMFAHKFRSPLDAIIYNTEHEHQEKLYRQAAQTMRGLLDIFSLVATDADKLQDRLKQDCRGNGNLITAFSKVLDMVLLHLLSASAKGLIRQHYLRYAKAQGLCDVETSSKQWYEDCRDVEQQLQQDWEQSYAQLLSQSATLAQRLAWLESHFFKLELLGFERDDIRFDEYGITESLLTIVLNEFLVNVFKYYASGESAPVVLEWISRDGHQVLACRNPSTRHERTRIKGSGKGHVFLSALARKIGSEFIKPKPADNFVVEFPLADELLISN